MGLKFEMFKDFLLGFRKFAMGAGFILISLVITLLGHLEAQIWAETGRDVVVAFMATNIGEHLIKAGKQWITDQFKMKVMEKHETQKR